MANGWTPERRARQSALIHTWRPWEKSAGPKTPQGKDKASRNAFKGGTRVILRELVRLLRQQCEALKRIGEALVLVVATLAKAPGEVPVHPPETAGQRLVEYLLRQFIQNKSSSPLMRGCA